MNSTVSDPQNLSGRQPRPFSLTIYLLLVAALSWPFQIIFAFYCKTPLSGYLLSSISMVMVTVATFIAGRYIFCDGFKNAGWSWGKPRHYLYVFLLALFIFALPTALELIFKARVLPGGVPLLAILGNFALYFVATLIPSFGEEFGWRGYMLPHLTRRFSLRKALIIHGFIWWAWHLPFLVSLGANFEGVEGPVSMKIGLMLLITLIPSMMNAVLFAYVWAASGSLAVASVYHSAFDEVRDAIEKTIGFGPWVSLWEMAVTTLLGMLVLWKGNWSWLKVEKE